jgi:hypothetical protein
MTSFFDQVADQLQSATVNAQRVPPAVSEIHGNLLKRLSAYVPLIDHRPADRVVDFADHGADFPLRRLQQLNLRLNSVLGFDDLGDSIAKLVA